MSTNVVVGKYELCKCPFNAVFSPPVHSIIFAVTMEISPKPVVQTQQFDTLCM